MVDLNFAAKSLFVKNVYNITELLDRIYLQDTPSSQIGHYWEGVRNFTTAMVLIRRTLPRAEKKQYVIPWCVRFEGHA